MTTTQAIAQRDRLIRALAADGASARHLAGLPCDTLPVPDGDPDNPDALFLDRHGRRMTAAAVQKVIDRPGKPGQP
jgi:hypothetical protein